MPALLERWRTLRDRLLGDQRFHRFAAAFPLTRPVARRNSQRLFDLCAGFVYSQTLAACIRLDLFDMLATPQPLDALAARTDLAPERLERLLLAAAAIGLVERRREGWGLGSLGAALRGVPGLPEMIRHHDLLYADLADPVALLQGRHDTRLGRFWGYAGGARTHELGTDEAAPYSALMAASQALVAEETLAAYPLGSHRCLMDVGGGEGAFVAAAARHAPDLALRLFDLPAVATRARERFATLGLGDRAQAFGGDFLRDPLPQGADIISLVRVLHDHDDAAAGAILTRIRAALRPGATLLLSEPMAGGRRPNRAGDAYFGLYLLAMGAGRARPGAEIAAMLRHAGFRAVRQRPTRRPILTSVLTAEAA